MKSNYAKKLNNANIILGIHAAFKLVIILILFVVLYTSIWIKEQYLTYVKASVYVQIFVFLTLSMVMLVLNNPHSMDICSNFINYFYLIISILEFGIIIVELFFMIKNLNNFLIAFHECPYCRTFQDITELELKRTCLYYNVDHNNELPYKYICYYNSETEYYNSFCDGLFCKKNKNKNEINSLVKCYKNIDKNDIKFPSDNEFYLKEFELIYRYRSSNLYACFRKEKIELNEKIFNTDCPDSNPVKKMLIFIYSDLILHILIDFLFIYEFILILKLKEIYANLVLLKNANQANILTNEDEINIQNLFNNSINKQTYNTDNANPGAYTSYQIQRQNSQTIIIAPGYKNSEIEEIKSNYNEQDNNITNINKSTESQLNQYDDIIVHYSQSDEEIKNGPKTENDGVLSRKAKIFRFKKKNSDENNKNERDSKQKMVIMDAKRDEEYGINRINFFIRKKSRRKSKKNKNNLNEDKGNNNDNINNIKNGEENKFDIFNNINLELNNNSRNANANKNIEINSQDCNSINILNDENKEKKRKNKSKQNDNFKKKNNELLENNLNINEITNNKGEKKREIFSSNIRLNEEEKNIEENNEKHQKQMLSDNINIKRHNSKSIEDLEENKNNINN
jgi:hypothetical protein